mmetsp:Transcript_21227/g.22649  ORF Transcript_21227/g.22649 Transcript_21227/m.22649 type:complete len:577 (+) Transcript_21227:69-1799(+)
MDATVTRSQSLTSSVGEIEETSVMEAAKDPGGPSHVLMNFSYTSSSKKKLTDNLSSPTSISTSTSPKQLLLTSGDYIYKRKKAYESSQSSISSSTNSMFPTIWDGVFRVEKELVECCERLHDDYDVEDGYDDDDDDEDKTIVDASSEVKSTTMPKMLGGVLVVEKEVRFCAILARSCHTIGSKSLALAILERSLEVYLEEEKRIEKFFTSDDGVKDDKNVGLKINNNNNNNQDNNNDYNNKIKKANISSQCTRYQNRRKRLRLDMDGNASDKITTSTVESIGNSNRKTKRKQRFENFFAAGGLRILNQWLIDASSYDIIVTSNPAQRPTTNSTSVTGENVNIEVTTEKKANTTRPIILTMLHFLEKIPFEKKTVMNSKINKQIQKLGKKVAVIREAHKNGQASNEDLDNWTTNKFITDDIALSLIQTGVDAVKKSWREKASENNQILQSSMYDPFQSLKSKVREWSSQIETGNKNATHSSSLSTKGKIANGRGDEIEEEKPERGKRKKIKQVQSSSQKSLQELREKLRKRKIETGVSPVNSLQSKIGNKKRVVWKDGLKSHLKRNRQMLEEVFVFT